MASKDGAIPTEFTDSNTRLLRGELSATSEATVGLGKATGGTKLEASHTAASQIVRKAIIQSTFRRLRATILSEVLFTTAREAEVPTLAWSSLERLLADAETSGHAYKSGALQRGRLVELTVELDADILFRASTMIDVFGDLHQEMPEHMRGQLSGISDAMAMGRVLEKLLAGLVPLRCRVVDYCAIKIDGQDWVVHRRILEQAPFRVESFPLYLVGVAEQALFWKDLRRILFSRVPVQVLGRIAKPSVHTSWQPVKLIDVVGQFAPEFASSMTAVSRAMNRSLPLPDRAMQSEMLFERALVRYARSLAELAHTSLVGANLKVLSALAASKRSVASSEYDLQVDAFKDVGEATVDRLGISVDHGQVVNLRRATMLQLQEEVQAAAASRDNDGPVSDECRYLDCEVVAIYW